MDDLDTLIDGSFQANDGGVDDTIADDTTIDEAAGGEVGKGKGKPVDGDEVDGETVDDGAGEDGEGDGSDGSDDETLTEDDKEKKQEPPQKLSRAEMRAAQIQENIKNLTTEKYRLMQENEQLRLEQESRPPEFPPKPDPNKYTFDKNVQGDRERAIAQFNQDVGKWEAACESIKTAHENKGAQRIQSEQQRYFSKMAAEKSVYGDYGTAVQTLGSFKMTPELHEALAHDDNNTDLFCFLGNPKNRAVANEVFGLKGYSQARKLAEISVKLQAAKSRQQAKPSSAKTPVGKPKGGKGGAGGIDFDKMSDADYRKLMGKAKAKLGKL